MYFFTGGQTPLQKAWKKVEKKV